MGDPEVIIDLDLHSSPAGPQLIESHPDDRPLGERWRAFLVRSAEVWSRDRRRWLAAIVACGVLLGAGGAATRPGPPVAEILTFTAVPEICWFGDGRLVTCQFGKITVYDLRRATVAWTADVEVREISVEVAGPWLFITSYPPDNAPSDQARVEVRDLRTGAVQPQVLNGSPRQIAPELLAVQLPRATSSPAGRQLHIHDLHTLAPLWSTPDPIAWQANDDGSIVYTLSASGTLEELDGATGARLRSVQLDLPKAQWVQMRVTDHGLLLRHGNRPTDSETLDLTDVWIERATLRPALSGPFLRFDCGQMLCGFEEGPDQAHVTILDPASKRPLWVTDAAALLQSPVGLLAATVDPLSSRFGAWPLRGLLDERTGVVRTAIPAGWQAVPETADYRSAYLASSRYATRTDPVREVTYLGEITAAGIQPLGALGFRVHSCESVSNFLVCSDFGARVHVLRQTAPSRS